MNLQQHDTDYQNFSRPTELKPNTISYSQNATKYDIENETSHYYNQEKVSSSNLHTWKLPPWLVEKCSIVDDANFQFVVICMILVNTVQMGIATSDFVTDYGDTFDLFHQVDIIFMLFFSVEIVMQFMYRGMSLFNNSWLTFDAIVVGLTWIIILVPAFIEFRAIRVFRLIVKIKEMRNLVTALLGATKRISAVAMLLLIIFYIFGVVFTLLFKDLEEDGYTDQDYFSRLDITFFTLFRFMTMDWSYVTQQVMIVYPWAWAPIIAFIILTSFIVINLVIAVICESVGDVQRMEIEENVMQMNSMVTNTEEQNTADMKHLEKKIDNLQQIIEELRHEMKEHKD